MHNENQKLMKENKDISFRLDKIGQEYDMKVKDLEAQINIL